MKKIVTFIIAVVATIMTALGPVAVSPAVFAEDGKCVLTTTLGHDKCDKDGNKQAGGPYNCSCDDGQGGEVKAILVLVVNIMSVGIGVLAVIGIIVSGIQYLTAGGNEERTRKAKRRILEIVIGLVAYALLYGILYFLLPEFNGVNS